ncbi:MAG: dockerin type I domain-containing protein [Gemmatimonadaceae bacterium]
MTRVRAAVGAGALQSSRRWANSVSLLLALAGGLVLTARVSAQRPAPFDMREGDPRERAEYFTKMRAYPNATIPPEKMAALREMRASIRQGAFRSSVSIERWQPMGPVGFISMNTQYSSTPMTDEGRFTSIAINPQDPRVIFAGSGSAGVWRTTNSGASWTPLTDYECSTSVGHIAIDPVDPSIVYVGTGEIFDPDGRTDGCGILRSTDGGNSFTRQATSILAPGGRLGGLVYRIAIDRASAGSSSSTNLWAATSAGVLVSNNSGTSWLLTLAGEATDVVQHPTNPAIVYAALGFSGGSANNGVYRSTNGGQTWSLISLALGAPNTIGRTALAVSPSRPTALWAIMHNPANRKFRSLQRYEEGNGAWTGLPSTGVDPDFGAQSEYNLLIAIDPQDANRIIVGGVRLFRSRDGGTTFQQIAANVHSDWHAVALDPSDPRRMVTGCDGGIFTSTNGGDTWRSLNNGISATQFYPGIAVHPTNPAVVVGGTQDNGSMMSGGALFWSGISYGDGGWAMIDYTNPNIIYTTSQNGNLQRHDLSTRSFQPIQPNFTFNPSFITPFVIDPVTPLTLYAGTSAVERSLNGGSSWGVFSPMFPAQITALAVSKSTPRVYFAGTQTGFIGYSQDGGASWFGGVLVGRSTSDMASDPNDPLRFGITFSGFGAASAVLTENGGQSFVDISGNLPDVPVQAITFTPDRNRIFVGTDIGVFETTDRGATWGLTNGLPVIPVVDLVYHAASNRIVAATYGRGIWTLALATEPPVLRGDVDRNGIVNAADALLIQRGLAAVTLPAPLTVMPHGDANCNGALDAADALIVLRFSVGLGNAGTCVNSAR